MDRKSFSTVIDETFSRMESDVRVLRTQRQTLTINIAELEKTRDKLSQEIADGEKKLSNVQEEYKNTVDSILKSAQEKLNRANSKEAEVSVKLAELNHKQKEAEDIIKSNQGLQKNLETQNEEVKSKFTILEGLAVTIEETLKDI